MELGRDSGAAAVLDCPRAVCGFADEDGALPGLALGWLVLLVFVPAGWLLTRGSSFCSCMRTSLTRPEVEAGCFSVTAFDLGALASRVGRGPIALLGGRVMEVGCAGGLPCGVELGDVLGGCCDGTDTYYFVKMFYVVAARSKIQDRHVNPLHIVE